MKRIVAEKAFREDLYFRLHVIPIMIPPLRERRDDILLLIDHFIEKHDKNKTLPRLSKASERLLLSFGYPGNVRQLGNIIQRAVTLCKGDTIEPHHLMLQAEQSSSDWQKYDELTFLEQKRRVVEQWEKDKCISLLIEANGGVNKAAELAKMDKSNFSKMLKRLGITPEYYKN